MISIDQNSHSLWDTLPKLQVLAAAKIDVTHYVEDIDVAFTQLGKNSTGLQLQIARERFYPSGGQDWGAGLFYTDFLGRLPTEPRNYEPQLGAKISRICKSVGVDIEQFYDTYAVSDNWQLIGPSYIAGGDYHRLIGDVSIAEVQKFLLETITRGEADTLGKFPHPDCRARTQQWFAEERSRVEKLIAANPNGTLPELYRAWLSSDDYLADKIECTMTSGIFDLKTENRNRDALLELFLRDYPAAAAIYNRAIAESHVGLNELQTTKGELPFFAVLHHNRHLVRTNTFCDAGKLVIDGESFALLPNGRLPIDALRKSGIMGLPGKAVVMGVQVRMLDTPAPLVLPDHGSLYMPGVHRFELLLTESGLLPQITNIDPIVRVSFDLLNRMKSLPGEIVIHLPEHLAGVFGCDEISAIGFSESYRDLAAQAAARLEGFKQPQNRQSWISDNFPAEHSALDAINSQRQELARVNSKDPQIRELHHRGRLLETQLQEKLVQQVFTDVQVSQLDYYNSRCAVLPWCYALGGAGFYDEVINNAEIFTESEMLF